MTAEEQRLNVALDLWIRRAADAAHELNELRQKTRCDPPDTNPNWGDRGGLPHCFQPK